MRIADLEMMSLYRSRNPSTESLVRLVAQWLGAYKPSPITTQMQYLSETEEKPLDPREKIRAAFSGVKMQTLGEIENVL